MVGLLEGAKGDLYPSITFPLRLRRLVACVGLWVLCFQVLLSDGGKLIHDFTYLATGHEVEGRRAAVGVHALSIALSADPQEVSTVDISVRS